MGLQVIGAGFGRTGTRSLQAALQILLGGKCFHYFEMSDHRPDLFPKWLDVARGASPRSSSGAAHAAATRSSGCTSTTRR